MGRLILVPQYPSPLRYQEWWWYEFPKQFGNHFDRVIVLDGGLTDKVRGNSKQFAPVEEAIFFEADQIKQFIELELQKDDILLLNDLSFPGTFANVLFHKKPSKCFAICHATSKNRYDYFAKDRSIKYPIEKSIAKLFDKIFVASQYHAEKLGWENIEKQNFPTPPFEGIKQKIKVRSIVSVARSDIQKRTQSIEQRLKRDVRRSIHTPNCTSWKEYYTFLSSARILLITSKEETYGYQVVDAVLNGCIPIAPNAMSYPELLPKEYLYNNYEELKTLVTKILDGLTPSLSNKSKFHSVAVPQLLSEKEANYFYIRTLLYMKGKI